VNRVRLLSAHEPSPDEPQGAEATYRGVPVRECIEDFRLCLTSRAVDERELTLHKQGRTYFEIAGSGHEALLAGLVRSLRPGYDWFFPYYRDLTLVLGLGLTPYEVLLGAVGAADDPGSGGRQMPSHWGAPHLNVVSQSSPTGSQCLPAVGCAEASRYLRDHPIASVPSHADELVYVSLGEGATSEGEFWESLNTACRLRLPVLYVVEDNGWAISVPSCDQAPAPISELVRGFPGLAVYAIDGCDYFLARAVGEEATARIRAGEGPALIHASVTRPFSHSSSDSQTRYRTTEDLNAERSRDPIVRLGVELTTAGVLSIEDVQSFTDELHGLVAEAAGRAVDAPRPDPKTATDHVWALPTIEDPGDPSFIGDPVFVTEAIRRTLAEQLGRDERIRIFGEDVADAPSEHLEVLDGMGGVFGTTLGLQRQFGSHRVYNTPLAEANIVGRGVGQALRGLRPAPEVQFFDYIWPAMHQIRSEAATTRWRSNGTSSVPMVLRVAVGGYITGGAIWHSQCGESIFTHIPGLVVVFPSRARDFAGLLRTAFACEDPVLFLEHKHLFRQRYAMDPFPPPEYRIPLGCASTVRPGEDLTIVTWGALVHRCLRAANTLADEGIEAEVIDLRTLAPWDRTTVLESVSRTSRVLVAHEDVLTSGFGAEIAAVIADECFTTLDAPVRRLGAPDAWVGYEPGLERAVLPQVDTIVDAIRSLVSF
jgi:2-oxoisovalerate dehydrogenase E1 component